MTHLVVIVLNLYYGFVFAFLWEKVISILSSPFLLPYKQYQEPVCKSAYCFHDLRTNNTKNLYVKVHIVFTSKIVTFPNFNLTKIKIVFLF